MFVGVGAARVRDLFEQARSQGAGIIFIDELDALGKARGAFGRLRRPRRERADAEPAAGRAGRLRPQRRRGLLAATNRPEILDPALLRAGRFDRQVLVDRPDRNGPRGDPAGARAGRSSSRRDVDLEPGGGADRRLRRRRPGQPGQRGGAAATRRKADAVDDGRLHRRPSSASSPGWRRRTACSTPKERQIVAYHEMGHALVGAVAAGRRPGAQVSIIPRGIGALGYTMQRPSEDRYLMTRSELVARIAVLLGGRAAEKLVFDELSTGAADDLAKATDIAREHGDALRHGSRHRPGGHRATFVTAARWHALDEFSPAGGVGGLAGAHRRRDSATSSRPVSSGRARCCSNTVRCWSAARRSCCRRKRWTNKRSKATSRRCDQVEIGDAAAAYAE